MKQYKKSPEEQFPDRELDEVLELKVDFMCFPTFETLKAYKKKFDAEKVKEVEDDLLDMWKHVVLEHNQ